jgi:hypothetical protein
MCILTHPITHEVIENVQLRTIDLGFEPASIGSTDWKGCVYLPSSYGDDKICLEKVNLAYPCGVIYSCKPEDLKPEDLPLIWSVVLSQDFTGKFFGKAMFLCKVKSE